MYIGILQYAYYHNILFANFLFKLRKTLKNLFDSIVSGYFEKD